MHDDKYDQGFIKFVTPKVLHRGWRMYTARGHAGAPGSDCSGRGRSVEAREQARRARLRHDK
jgi:hypothetical protein